MAIYFEFPDGRTVHPNLKHVKVQCRKVSFDQESQSYTESICPRELPDSGWHFVDGQTGGRLKSLIWLKTGVIHRTVSGTWRMGPLPDRTAGEEYGGFVEAAKDFASRFKEKHPDLKEAKLVVTKV